MRAKRCGWIGSGASDFNPAAGVLRMRPKRRRPAGDGDARRRAAAELADVPNLGFRGSVWRAGGTYTKRASTRTDLGRRLWRRGGDASDWRGGAGANSGEASPVATVHEDDDTQLRRIPHLLARPWCCSSMMKRQRRRKPKAAARLARARVPAGAQDGGLGSGGSGGRSRGGGAP
jgi:hypothetical protein